MRHVFPTAEIPHKWAHQTQEDARNPQGNLYFRGPVIYSYRDSWPLARIYTRKDGAQLVLTNSNKHSVTTARHQDAVNRAASHMAQIAVPHVQNAAHMLARGGITAHEHGENLKYLTDKAARLLKEAQRCQRIYAVNWKRREAFAALRDAWHYISFFGIRRKAPQIPTADWLAAVERVRRIENPDPASRDKRERAAAARRTAKALREKKARELAAVHAMAERSDWRLFGAFDCGRSRGWHRDQPCMLRVNGDMIETSQGARVPLAAAPMVWNLVQHARTNGAETTMFSKRYRIGDYPLDRIDADGTLHAGCHTIPFSELAMMARTLNLEE